MTGYYRYNAATEEEIRMQGMAIAGIRNAAKKHAVSYGLVAAITLIGILSVLMPITSNVVFMGVAAVGLAIYGVLEVMYYAGKQESHDGFWNMISGVIMAGFGIVSLAAYVINPVGMASVVGVLAFITGLMTLAAAADQFGVYRKMKRTDEEGAGAVLTNGLLNAGFSALLLINVVMGTSMVQWVWGVCLILAGFGFLTASVRKHASQEEA